MKDLHCPKCQEKITGKYCSECGTKGTDKNESKELIVKSWREESDLSLIIENPKVQTIIRGVLEKSKKSISADEFLKRVDLLLSPLTGISLKKMTDILLPLYKKLGIKTGKSKTAYYSDIIQEVLLKTLCSLAKNNYPLIEVKQAYNGIILIAEIPSDMRTFGGKVIISLQENDEEVQVSIDAKIKGQLYDWGKSKSVIKNIYKDIEELKLVES